MIQANELMIDKLNSGTAYRTGVGVLKSLLIVLTEIRITGSSQDWMDRNKRWFGNCDDHARCIIAHMF